MNLRAGNSVIPISSKWCFNQQWFIESWLRCCSLLALQVFDTVAILALVPLFDQILYPLLKKNKFNMSMLSKIGKLFLLLIFDPRPGSWPSLSPLAAGAGFFCAMLSMLVAAGVEYFRLQYAPPGVPSIVSVFHEHYLFDYYLIPSFPRWRFFWFICSRQHYPLPKLGWLQSLSVSKGILFAELQRLYLTLL